MTDLRAQMIEDRALRDAAKALLDSDITNVREDFSGKGLAVRVKDRLTDGASEVYDEAVEVAADNKGALIAILAALVMWFARNPIADLFLNAADTQADDDAPSADGIEDLTENSDNDAVTNEV